MLRLPNNDRIHLRNHCLSFHVRDSEMIKKNVEITEVIQHYKGFEIRASREMSLGGEELLYYSISRLSDGWEMESSFSSGEDSPLSMVNYLRGHVEDFINHPEDYDE